MQPAQPSRLWIPFVQRVCCEFQLLQTWNSDAVFQGGIFSEYWIYYVVIYSIAFYIKMWYFLKELSGSIGVMMWLYDLLTYPLGSHCAKLRCTHVREKKTKSTCECEVSNSVAYYFQISLIIHWCICLKWFSVYFRISSFPARVRMLSFLGSP